MEKVKKALQVHRSAFQRIYEDTVKVLLIPDPDMIVVRGNIYLLEQKVELISELDRQNLDLMLESVLPEEDIDAEVAKADEIVSKFNRLRLKVEQKLNKDRDVETCSQNSLRQSNQAIRRLKLPRIEFIKFGGDIKDWLPFWSQFKRINDDEQIENEDKFQYLIQATIPKSRARQLVESYPPSDENYKKVIESLTARFGREDLLVEVYVRELLKLIFNNLNSRTKLSTLFDKMESQLRALETLGVTSEKCAAMLYPLVESCLPEEILRVWQRTTTYSADSSLKSKLDNLMQFLRKEVENEERISLAVSGFDIQKKKKIDGYKEDAVPTCSGLINYKKIIKCVFCKKEHASEECDEAKKWSLADKKKVLNEKGCCHLCLKYGHIARRCAVKIYCRECKGRHVTLMCFKKNNAEVENTSSEHQHTDKASVTVENLSNTTHDQVFLQTLVVFLDGNNKSRYVRAIIDTGSQRSYINKATVLEMGYVSEREEKITHALFGGLQSETVNHTCFKIKVGNLNKKYFCNFEALDQSVICSSVISIKEGPWMAELKELGIEITDTKGGPIEILIGADIAGKLFTGRKYKLQCGLVAIETLLGWTLIGKIPVSQQNIAKSSAMIVTSLFCHNTISNISSLWDLEVLGISDPLDRKSKKDAELAVMDHFMKTVTINEHGRYEANMPWIEGHPPLPSNYKMAKRRLDNLMKKLEKDGYYNDYNQVFSEWLAEGVIEEVSEDQLHDEGHYLPHRHVLKLSSATTKLRPVFDASAKEKSQPCLNQCLEKGVNLIELIPSLLIRFRLYRIGVIADIRKAFLQISLKTSDRDFLRFLWYDKEGHLKIYRHARVVFGVTCSPFLLGAVIEYHLQKALEKSLSGKSSYSSAIILKLLKNFYVDNCIVSLNSEEELQSFIQQSQELMAEAKFDLRAWEYTLSSDKSESINLSPVLGLNWNRCNDSLEISFESFKNIDTSVITKRTILSVASRVFDPIGFTCPILLCPKLLLRRIWILKLGWDTEIPEQFKQEMLDWLRKLNVLVNIKIPRWLLKEVNAKIEHWSVHVFCDASQNAYSTAIFLRTECNQDVNIQLLQAKARVSPMKELSIPRMELLATTIGSRLLKVVLENIEKKDISIYCWTDSTTVLSWIKQECQWKPFVWNRVQEILSLTTPDVWHYVPSNLNPADLPSRGCSPEYLLKSRWWEGPKWLLKSPYEWPIQDYEIDQQSVIQEMKKSVSSSLLCSKEDFSWYYRYFSKYQKILNLVGWMRRFIFNCRHPKECKRGTLSLIEIEEAENCVIRSIQEEAFVIPDKRLSSLCPYKDENGILRIKTKIFDREDAKEFRCPAILPSKHPVVTRLVYDVHVRNLHVGVQGLLSILRERFWIVGGRKTVKSATFKCATCRRHNSKKFETFPAPLPINRVRDANIFEVIGIDLAGPLFLRRGHKVWICLFTCAVYRAVHLELVSSLSTDSFLQALRRFVARRGRPSIVYSDNGTNFIGAENAFASLEWKQIMEYSNGQRISWKFNPPTAAWWGGWWERLIRVMKQLLRKILGKACLTYEELLSVVCECESIINSRPLTYMSENCQDLIPLTPAMFLHDVKETGVPDIDKIEANDLRRHIRHRQKVIEDLRKRFRNEYLSQLINHSKRRKTRDINVGEVVLIEKENLKRIDWPLARVEEVFPGKDGKIRLVRLKTSSGQLMRPIQRLFPLELHLSQDYSVLQSKFTEASKDSKVTSVNEVVGGSNTSEVVTRYGRVVKPPSRLKM